MPVSHTRILDIVGDIIRIRVSARGKGDGGPDLAGDPRVPIGDFVTHEKAVFPDLVYLQQDAFDDVDVCAPLDRHLQESQLCGRRFAAARRAQETGDGFHRLGASSLRGGRRMTGRANEIGSDGRHV